MKNIIKTIIVMFSSISLFASANAGELSVSGTAKATYNIESGKTNAGKGLGITNELNFTAAGELDNGYTWSYSMELDPNAVAVDNAGAQNDDTKLTLTTPYGTVGVFISEGGLDLEDAASQSVYGRPTDIGDPSATSDNFTIDSYNNIQYHTPADLLPFGLSGKVAYATNTADTAAGSSGNNAGAVTTGSATQTGANATEIQVKAAPIDGLAIGASYFEFGGDKGASKNDQVAESGAYYATYATGPFSVGYSKAYKAPHLSDDIGATTATTVEYYDQTNYSLAFAASDDISVSYEVEKSDANKLDDTSTEQKSSAIQLAYTMGGMTVAVSHASHDNNGYVADANTDQTLFAVTMAF
ncbi:porin [Candidatus Pelagibacter bacterium]|nr:porin [Candidatus Pelagibacter bacterium]